MPKNRHATLFVIDILFALEKIKDYSKSIEIPDDLMNDEMAFDAIIKQLENIGESIKYILNFEPNTSFIKKEWRAISDLRNIIVHEYFDIDFLEIFKILKYDLPVFEKEFFDFVKKIKNDVFLQKALVAKKYELEKYNLRKRLHLLQKIEKLLV
ncbi:MAG: HepT-like ribonuclease domain-containing protein [bacterium]